mmetsp:Transcript_20335/g.42391  ORF Transcript_20335/g.42391 Transcript_20335/m.42391 type:complete len:207 (-) Transcript_20335:204-824(-)
MESVPARALSPSRAGSGRRSRNRNGDAKTGPVDPRGGPLIGRLVCRTFRKRWFCQQRRRRCFRRHRDRRSTGVVSGSLRRGRRRRMRTGNSRCVAVVVVVVTGNGVPRRVRGAVPRKLEGEPPPVPSDPSLPKEVPKEVPKEGNQPTTRGNRWRRRANYCGGRKRRVKRNIKTTLKKETTNISLCHRDGPIFDRMAWNFRGFSQGE